MIENQSLQDLFIQLGKEQHESTSLSVKMPSRNELMKRGKRWWNNNKSKLQWKICNNYEFILKKHSNNRRLLLIAISDLISDIVLGVSPFTVAAIVLSIGVDSFCSTN